jgi:hypothetical protein
LPLLESLGLAQAASIGCAGGFFHEGQRHTLYLHCPNGRQGMLAAIRRQAFSATGQTPADGEAVKQTVSREAMALAAAAAESKGVELSPKGLEIYAKAVDPDLYERQDQGQQDGRFSKNQNGAEFLPQENDAKKTAALALASEENDPLLAILNKLPGKDGRHWIVLPFEFCEKGRSLKVSLRILLEIKHKQNSFSCFKCNYLALDITEKTLRWLFVLESAEGIGQDLSAVNRLVCYHQTNKTRALKMAGELSKFLGIPLEKIFIKTKTFPFEAGCQENLLHSINKAV